MDNQPVLGIDIGSVSVSLALVGPDGEILATSTRPHRGLIREALARDLEELRPGLLLGVCRTGSSPDLIAGADTEDPQVCLIRAARNYVAAAGDILFVGGERFGLIRRDDQGSYVGTRANTSCAAGTGSFLDQQARRLGLAGTAELARTALRSRGEPPRISTRCAVFARTDLVHAQQAGHGLEEICDGLCRGVARNIADTVLGGEPPRAPLLLAGGVAANEAVRRHLEATMGVTVVTHALSPVLAALGAALALLEYVEAPQGPRRPRDLSRGIESLILRPPSDQVTHYPPLRAAPPGPTCTPARHAVGRYTKDHPVEVETYAKMADEVWIGVDVGSTSTKAMITGPDGAPVLGLYARTLGRPVTAAQALLEALASAGSPRVLGLATTGAGRKLLGGLLGADLVVDEITTHARAAVEERPDVDTIIEIGGQDAKFTTLREGRVTFSAMNTVCAAGTGSFLEEQALRLGVDLEEYATRTPGVSAPLVSDRCAVFMERDINELLARGFTTPQILAACLYAVRENYLSKVARGAGMGRRVSFQGATARNGALVAVFEEGLGQRVYVSRWCHLTGAWGAALLAREEAHAAGLRPTTFRGVNTVIERDIPLRAETCGLCANHCRLKIAVVAGKTLAYGFLCGRDYDTHTFVSTNRTGFDLAAARRKAYAAECLPATPPRTPVVIGLPSALSMHEELPVWKRFFAELGVPVITSETLDGSVARGRNLQGAEFCAPITALHGHVEWLSRHADYVFLPQRFTARSKRRRSRQYCYYTQYAPALVGSAAALRERCLRPLCSSPSEIQASLMRAGIDLTTAEVEGALERAWAASDRAVQRLRLRFDREIRGLREPAVLLLGRPYTVHSPEMNKGIPGLFAAQGVKVFSQEMVSARPEDTEALGSLLRAVHWHHAASILEAALVAARTPLLYPVLVTSFKCSPDSFAAEYLRRILDEIGKPYLVLQLDDHDSTMGYETRIEAGVRAFRNHAAAQNAHPARTAPPPHLVLPRVERRLDGRTLLFPPWDPLVIPLVAASLRREGVDARVLTEDTQSIRRSMRHNTGQCIPLNAIAEEAMDYVERNNLDPERTALWLPRGTVACNFPLFPSFIQTLFRTRGEAMGRMPVYSRELTLVDFGPRAALHGYRAALVGGLLRAVGCRLRPYEAVPGSTDDAISRAMQILLSAFAEHTGSEHLARVRRAAESFSPVVTLPGRRPKVAIFGDLYVRDNDVMNQGLIRTIENAGGEAVCTSLVDYWRIVIGSYYRRWFVEREIGNLLVTKAAWTAMERTGRAWEEPFAAWLDPTTPIDTTDERVLERLGIRIEHAGESFDNLLKVLHLRRTHPDLRLFVQANPAFCCPSLVTEALARDIREITGVPVVSLTYDGTGGLRNDALVPYLRYAPGLAPAPVAAAIR